MKILITGGLGYVGGRIADHLRKRIPPADIYLTTRDDKRPLPAWSGAFTIARMDVLDPAAIAACLDGKKIDVIIHLAALNDVQSAKDPEAALEVNVRGTYRLLERAKAAGVRRFIYFSTIHVYGPVLSGTLTEESPTAPVHPYGATHRAAEDIVNYFHHYHGMQTLIFRMSNGYGYPMNKEVDAWSLVFNDLCRQLVTTGKIILRSSGKQRRDFIALSDAAAAVEHFLFSAGDSAWNRLYNLGSGRPVSVLEVAEQVRHVFVDKFGREPGVVTAAADQPGSQSIAVDYRVDKIAAAGFVPRGDMSLEINKTLQLCARSFAAGGLDAGR